jgi:hypothetical protein
VNPSGDAFPLPLAATAAPFTAEGSGAALQNVASTLVAGQFGFVEKLDCPHAAPALTPT